MAVEDAGVSCSIDADNTNQYLMTAPNSNNNMINYVYAAASLVRHAAVFRDGILSAFYYVAEEGGEALEYAIVRPDGITGVYKPHDYPLLLGCGVGWYQTRQHFAPMTMRNFEVWGYAMTAEEAKAKLEAL